MKLRHISEAKTQTELDQEVNQKRQEEIKKFLDDAQQAFNNSNIAKVMENSGNTFAELLKLAKNESSLLHSDSALQTQLLNSMAGINPAIANVTIGKDTVISIWGDALTKANNALIQTFSKMRLESKTRTIEEGILSSIGGLFFKVVGFLIKTTAAGLAAGAAFGAAMAGNKYGGYGRGGNYDRSSKGEKMQGEIEVKYKIALLNAKYVDALLKALEPTAESLLKDTGVKKALGIP